jgi:calcium-dependent protein kinase
MIQAAMTAIATNLDSNEISHLKDVFLAMDTDHSGTLSFEEIEEGLKKLNLERHDEILQTLKEADFDGNGQIEYTEFIAATMDR